MKRITPEAFFRIADRDQTQTITPAEFKEALSTLKINMERSQMQRILMILDEDVSGEISKTEYHHALEAYGIQCEKHNNDNGRSFPLEH